MGERVDGENPGDPAAVALPIALSLPRHTGRPPRPCDAGMPLASGDACNTALSTAARVAALVAAINATEAVGLFNSGSAGVPRLGVPPIQWWNEALHGACARTSSEWGTGQQYSVSTRVWGSQYARNLLSRS